MALVVKSVIISTRRKSTIYLIKRQALDWFTTSNYNRRQLRYILIQQLITLLQRSVFEPFVGRFKAYRSV